MIVFSHPFSRPVWLALAISSLLVGCASVGPNFEPPVANTPSNWTQRNSSSPELTGQLPISTATLPAAWWRVFNDSTLDALQQRALENSPDLQTAALRFAQARIQQRMTSSLATPEVGLTGQASRQRQSQHAPETRLVNAVGGPNTPQLIDTLSDPFSLYQVGFDMSWELDLWGRVRRSIEAAQAHSTAAAAQLLDMHVTLSGELARTYFQLRQIQHQQALLDRKVAIAQDMLALQIAQARNGLSDEMSQLEQTQNVAGLQAQQSTLQAQRGALLNQLGLMTGDEPGALTTLLAPHQTLGQADNADIALPALTLGQPADWLRQRPDVRAAEAKLHAATAEIGVAIADLYPRISFGASAGLQSLDTSNFAEWGSRMWQIGPVLSLPLFDRGRRRANVELHRQDQQIAAIAWRQSVLKAWQELDDALTSHAAERQRNQRLRELAAASHDQFVFSQVRVRNGLSSELVQLQSELAWWQTQSAVIESDAQLRTSLVAVYKAAGGGVDTADTQSMPSEP